VATTAKLLQFQQVQLPSIASLGICVALRAQPAIILTDVVLDELLVSRIVAASLGLEVMLTRVAASYLSADDQPGALALCATAFVILAAAVIASAVPAVRAARVNAVEALRAE
jgi:ABC-type lipoprotein release transport system permease subunit